jgi:hypothetical protein
VRNIRTVHQPDLEQMGAADEDEERKPF